MLEHLQELHMRRGVRKCEPQLAVEFRRAKRGRHLGADSGRRPQPGIERSPRVEHGAPSARPCGMHEAVAANASTGFRDECCEQPIPDDQDAAEIAVEAAWLDRMMNAMMRRRVEDKLDPRR